MSKVPFGMLSVKAGIDKNPKPTLADRIAGAKKAMAGRTFKYDQGGQTPQGFTMTGQYAVARELGDMGRREFVMYDKGDGSDPVKVYGNWNEYAVGRDDQGRDYIADESYPIIVNADGEFVLDEARFNEIKDTEYERAKVQRIKHQTEFETEGQENRTDELLRRLEAERGPRGFRRR